MTKSVKTILSSATSVALLLGITSAAETSAANSRKPDAERAWSSSRFPTLLSHMACTLFTSLSTHNEFVEYFHTAFVAAYDVRCMDYR